MNNQKIAHTLSQSLQLAAMVMQLNNEEKHIAADVIREADVARLLHGTTIQKELKRLREGQKGKVKRFLTCLAKNPHAQDGVDVLFEKWSEKLDANTQHLPNLSETQAA